MIEHCPGVAHGPAVVRTRAALAAALRTGTGHGTDAEGGELRRRVVVMTMGALHSGHLGLVRAARREAGPDGQVVVTIFVNPLQFGPGEDLDQYPRDLEGDLVRLAKAGADVDVVFAPDESEMYPDGPIVRITAGRIGQVLEGAARPGHFDGVLTVVLKLLHLVGPDAAVFGEKDAQQLMAVRRMVLDLNLPVQIVGLPIVRDADGLALSSRNAYLDEAERRRALVLGQALRAGQNAQNKGVIAVRSAAEAVLVAGDVRPDYLVLVDPTTVEDVPEGFVGPALLLVAATVGTTRLIDNTAVTLTSAGGV